MKRFGAAILILSVLSWSSGLRAEETAAEPAADAPAAASQAGEAVEHSDGSSSDSHEDGQKSEEVEAEDEASDDEPIVRPEPDVREKELIATIKMLYSAQDAVAAGHNDAKSLQASLLGLILSKKYDTQRMTGSGHLAHYLAGYLLSGGDPRLVEALMASSKFDEGPANLLNGCILYRKGKREDALKALEAVDLASLSATVVGRVALARAVITPDHKARERLLAIAIATMPGTLVEESALRRSALGFSEISDRQNFWKRVDRYTRRFPRSGYLPDFSQQVASAAVRLAQSSKQIDAAEMDQSLSRISESERQKVYIALARLGSSRHMPELIAFAAGRLSRISVPGSQEEKIAELYRNAYSLLQDGAGGQRQALRDLDPTRLPEQERRLLMAALSISDEIEAPMDTAVTVSAPEATPLTSRAETLLKNADKLLQEPM